MRKANFDLAKASTAKTDDRRYRKALQTMRAHEDILNSRPKEITGHWVGMKEGVPYVMVALESGSSKNPDKLLPDKLGGYHVYYVEGRLHLAKH